MLAYIKGILEMKMTEYVVIDVGGLGYKVFMSENGIEKLGNIGDIVKVHTFYKVREDDISIFGFNTLEELKMFELLLGVSGVGAKTALAEAEIKIYPGVKGACDKAVLDFAMGRLDYDPDTLCSHHDHEHGDHDCGSHSCH